MQPQFTYNFMLACNQQSIHTAMETSGYARWEVMSRLAGVTDLLLYDIKFIDSDRHQRYTGVPNERILNNLEGLAAQGHTIQVRVPCIPRVNDDAEQIGSIARFVAGLKIESLALLPYNAAAGAKYQWVGRPFTQADRETQTEEDMASLVEIAYKEGLRVQVGG